MVVTAIFGSVWGHIRGVEERTKAVRSGSVTPDSQGPVVKIPTPQGQCEEKHGRGEKDEKEEDKE